MKTKKIVLSAIFTSGIIAQSTSGCAGDNFVQNDVSYCCVNGEFSGSVISSFSAKFSSESASRSSFQSSLQASLSSQFGNSGIQTNTAQITAAPKLKPRAITTEATSGLTCIGDILSSSAANGNGGASTTISNCKSRIRGLVEKMMLTFDW